MSMQALRQQYEALGKALEEAEGKKRAGDGTPEDYKQADDSDTTADDSPEGRKVETPSKCKKSADEDSAPIDLLDLMKSAVSEAITPLSDRIATLEKKLAEPVGRKSTVQAKGEEKLQKTADPKSERDLRKSAIDGASDFRSAYTAVYGTDVAE